MRIRNIVLLLAAAFSQPSFCAVRREILHRQAPQYVPYLNTTVATSPSVSVSATQEHLSEVVIPPSTLETETLSRTTSLSRSTIYSRSIPTHGSHGVETNPPFSFPSEPSTLLLGTTGTKPLPSASSASSLRTAKNSSGIFIPSTTEVITSLRPSSQWTSVTNSSLVQPGSSNPPSSHQNFTITPSTTPTLIDISTKTTAPPITCTKLRSDEPITEYSIIYTATVTFYGNRSDYTPPYPEIETPTYCGTTDLPVSSAPAYSHPGEFTTAPNSRTRPPFKSVPIETASEDTSQGRSIPTAGCTISGRPCDEHPPAYGITTLTAGVTQSTRVHVTFITTDKNPSVVFPPDPVPRFRTSGSSNSVTAQDHRLVPGFQPPANQPISGSGHNEKSAKQQLPQPTFSVTAQGPQVIINKETISDLKPGQTRTVSVSGGTFTIFPSSIVGEGFTIGKPAPVGTAVAVVTPTSALLGGRLVVVSGSEAVIDGTRFEIPQGETIARLNDDNVTIMPGKVVIDGQSLAFEASGTRETDIVVQGGDMITLIGKSIYVHHSTTLTYGPGIRETTEVVDGDVLTIGPSGVNVHGTFVGGGSAEATDTFYDIAGGATITKMSPSLAVINGITYTVGPGSKSTTLVIGGEIITIGSNGVIVSIMTLSYPFGPSMVTTISGFATGSDGLPKETSASEGNKEGNGNKNQNGNDGKDQNGKDDGKGTGEGGGQDGKDDDSLGRLTRPSLLVGATGLCIAMGVWIFV